MWKRTSPAARLATCAASGALCSLLAAPASAAPLRAGFAVASLPAPEGGPLAGYGGLRTRTARGLADPPEARVLVLESEELRVALVALDLVIIRPALRDALLGPARDLDIDALLVLATHTHAGPGGYMPGFLAERITAGGYVTGALEGIAAAAREALEKATARLAPARAASARGSLVLAENRRRANGPRETDLPVLRLDVAGSSAPVAVFSYGMHATVLSPSNRRYSADWVGAARDALEARGWRPLFVAGPLGDQGPASELGPLWSGDAGLEAQQAREVGAAVAESVHVLARDLEPRADARLAALERWQEVPALRVRRFCALWWFSPFVRGSLRRFLSERVPIQALRVGEARFVALPAEPASSLGAAIRERAAPGSVPFVLAHANDWLGYAVSREEYAQGGYEACLSFYGPGLGEWLVDGATRALDELEARSDE